MGLETNIGHWIALHLAPLLVVLFRNNTGFYKEVDPKTGKKRFIRYGVGPHKGGGSDHIGWKSEIITQKMVGRRVAIFTAIEVKTLEGEEKENQIKFINAVRKAGGYAGFARSRKEADLIFGIDKQ